MKKACRRRDWTSGKDKSKATGLSWPTYPRRKI